MHDYIILLIDWFLIFLVFCTFLFTGLFLHRLNRVTAYRDEVNSVLEQDGGFTDKAKDTIKKINKRNQFSQENFFIVPDGDTLNTSGDLSNFSNVSDNPNSDKKSTYFALDSKAYNFGHMSSAGNVVSHNTGLKTLSQRGLSQQGYGNIIKYNIYGSVPVIQPYGGTTGFTRDATFNFVKPETTTSKLGTQSEQPVPANGQTPQSSLTLNLNYYNVNDTHPSNLPSSLKISGDSNTSISSRQWEQVFKKLYSKGILLGGLSGKVPDANFPSPDSQGNISVTVTPANFMTIMNNNKVDVYAFTNSGFASVKGIANGISIFPYSDPMGNSVSLNQLSCSTNGSLNGLEQQMTANGGILIRSAPIL